MLFILPLKTIVTKLVASAFVDPWYPVRYGNDIENAANESYVVCLSFPTLYEKRY